MINQAKPTELLPITMWVFQGERGAVLCTAQGECKRPKTDPTACYGCPVAWRDKNGKREYRYKPVHEQARA